MSDAAVETTARRSARDAQRLSPVSQEVPTPLQSEGLSLEALPDVRHHLQPADRPMALPRVGALVRVQWRDAWFEFDGPEEKDDYLVHTVGFVVKDGPRFLHIASEMLPDDGWRAVTAIPLECITNWKELG